MSSFSSTKQTRALLTLRRELEALGLFSHIHSHRLSFKWEGH